mmetsp:Transcript_13118/g.17932  ORF Transcript_13118/g.17932 Transcript_13118/m.17932 type:complete len:266 (+) Transcript_13118:65-862(+)
MASKGKDVALSNTSHKPGYVSVTVAVPAGVRPGNPFDVSYHDRLFRVICPAGVRSGQRVTIKLKGASGASSIPLAKPIQSAPVSNVYLNRYGKFPDAEQAWPFGIFGCFTYKSPDTRACMWIPTFIPKALCLPCCVAAYTHSALIGEPTLSDHWLYNYLFGWGPQGCVVCAASCFLFQCAPLACLPFPCLCTCYQRKQIIEKYRLLGLQPGQKISLCDKEVLKGCCVPCASTQHYEFLRLQYLDPETRAIMTELTQPPDYQSMEY